MWRTFIHAHACVCGVCVYIYNVCVWVCVWYVHIHNVFKKCAAACTKPNDRVRNLRYVLNFIIDPPHGFFFT